MQWAHKNTTVVSRSMSIVRTRKANTFYWKYQNKKFNQ